jgi:putative copper export protein
MNSATIPAAAAMNTTAYKKRLMAFLIVFVYSLVFSTAIRSSLLTRRATSHPETAADATTTARESPNVLEVNTKGMR